MKKLNQVANQVVNKSSDAHGKFVATDANILRRFLIMGNNEDGYYYPAEQRLSTGLESLEREVKRDGLSVVNMILEISENGYNIKQEPVIFALVYCLKLGDEVTKTAAENVFNRIVRTGTMLFIAAEYSKLIGGWGRKTKRTFANWYLKKDSEKLAYQVLKYRTRNSWSHRDILRLVHPKTQDLTVNAIFKWAVNGEIPQGVTKGENMISVFETLKKTDIPVKDVCSFIDEFNLTWEMIPTDLLKDKSIVRQLGMKMPIGATIRFLNRFSALNIEDDKFVETVAERLTNKENITQGKLHPLFIYTAIKQYSSGKGMKGSLVWDPNPKFESALDKCLELSFRTLEPTGKKISVNLDVSGSMSWGTPVSALECAAVMCKAFIMAEGVENVHTSTFSHNLTPLNPKIFVENNIKNICENLRKLNFGYTNLSLPVDNAHKQHENYDCFIIYTDNEVNYGNKPHASLKKYREAINPEAKYVVHAFELSKFTVADPKDLLSLDICGNDPSSAKITQMFLNGEL